MHVALNGQWLRVNQRLCDLLGYSREELQGPDAAELTQSEQAAGEDDALRQMVVGTLHATSSTKSDIAGATATSCGPESTFPCIVTRDGQPQHFISGHRGHH